MPDRFRLSTAIVGLAVLSAGAASFACVEERRTPSAAAYDTEVGALFSRYCVDCHREGSWTPTSYFGAIGCVRSGTPAVLPAGDDAPVLRVLGDATHARVLPAKEQAILRDWVARGAPKRRSSVHDAGFVDPRSPQFHGRFLRREAWQSMRDANSATACGRCHEGSPSGRPDGVTESAPGATACTTCHTEPGGATACSTCHGEGGRAFPPRDPCFFPEDAPRAGAHAAHAVASATRSDGLACTTCHPVPTSEGVFSGAHANGTVDVAFDPKLAGGEARYDMAAHACFTSCHSREGAAKPTPSWTDRGPLGCSDCHGAPPPQHPAGPCTSCHREPDALGTKLTSPHLHINGKIDLGDGSGACGACHGNGADPWPTTGAHATHRSPAHAAGVACETCHVVPNTFGPGTHPQGGAARVALGGLATMRGVPASFTGGTCTQVYCHGAGLEGTAAAAPQWTDSSGGAKACGACHSLPPAAPHIANPSCWTCHPSVVDPSASGPVIGVPTKHVNGEVNR
jgi:predicted CxxxxCH...CXXCH cytochrome family protein